MIVSAPVAFTAGMMAAVPTPPPMMSMFPQSRSNPLPKGPRMRNGSPSLSSWILLVASPIALTVMLLRFPSIPETDMGISSMPGTQTMMN